MKRAASLGTTENYEQVLMCLICRNLFDDIDHQPKFLPCHHTFCKECLREYVRQMGDEIECPSCRKLATIPAAGVPALQTNFYVKYIESLVCNRSDHMSGKKQCMYHEKEKAVMFCQQCQIILCKDCCKNNQQCSSHQHIPLTTVTEQSHQKLDNAFTGAHATIERKKLMVEGMLKCLAEEKDSALLKVESTFDSHIHLLTRRATLLKNKVIDIYRENTQKLEDDLEEISTALTCIVSLKEYHEEKISEGDFWHYKKGIEDIKDVDKNTSEKIRPQEIHIVFQDKHGVDKFKPTVKDLGKVKFTRPLVARSEPEGNDCDNESPITQLTNTTDSLTRSTYGSLTSSTTKQVDETTKTTLALTADQHETTNKEPSDLLNNNGSTEPLQSEFLDARPKTLTIKNAKCPSTPTIKQEIKKLLPANLPSMTSDNMKSDKNYYHTVYTSYDEEELLKELNNKPNTWKPVPEVSSEEEPDSLLTSSTISTIEDTDEISEKTT